MSIYTDAAESANAALKEYGAPAVLKSKAAPVYDPATSKAIAATPVSVTVSCVVFAYPSKFIDGTLIRQGDKKVLMSARGAVSPKPGDTLVWGGVDYSVINVKPLAPALVNIYFDTQIRSA